MMGDRGLFGAVVEEGATVLKASQRVAALALVDASVAVPSAKPLLDMALSGLSLRTSGGGEFQLYRPSKRPAALLVLCHPSGGSSLCRTLAQVWEEELGRAGIECRSVDLCSQEYVGLNNASELRAALSKPESYTPPEVTKLQNMVEECRFLVFVHPVFWFDVPSQLKGFLESVLSSGFAFRKLPSCWTLNRAVGILERLPMVPSLLRRYSAYGMLRDKSVFVTRTLGGPRAGLGFFGHASTSLESSFQFCGAHLVDVQTIAEVDDKSSTCIDSRDLPNFRRKVAAHCAVMAAEAVSFPAIDDTFKKQPLAPAIEENSFDLDDNTLAC